MKLISSDFKKPVKLKIENLDDLWYLNQLIDTNDIVSGKTFRKIKIGKEGERKQTIVKKPVFLKIKVEKLEFSKHSNVLRISGTVTEAPEDIALGSYHTFNVEENTIIKIQKENWLHYQIEKIKEASAETKSKILVCVHDREEAYFALIKKYGFDILSSIKGNVTKKADLEKIESKFYKDIIKQLEEYDKRHGLNKIILASPAFWKEDLMKELNNQDLKKKILLATCSDVGENGINEVLRRPETSEALKQDRISKEMRHVEELLEEISKNNLASYGLEETKNAVGAGAVRTLLLTDEFIQKKREENVYEEIEIIIKNTDSSKGTVVIVSSEHEAGKKLNGLGGIGAILRYKIS